MKGKKAFVKRAGGRLPDVTKLELHRLSESVGRRIDVALSELGQPTRHRMVDARELKRLTAAVLGGALPPNQKEVVDGWAKLRARIIGRGNYRCLQIGGTVIKTMEFDHGDKGAWFRGGSWVGNDVTINDYVLLRKRPCRCKKCRPEHKKGLAPHHRERTGKEVDQFGMPAEFC